MAIWGSDADRISLVRPSDFGILAMPGFVLSLPLGLLLGRRLRWVLVAGVVGAAAFVGIGVTAVLDAMRDPYPLAWTTRENAALIAAWCVMSAVGWLFGIAIGAALRRISWRELAGRMSPGQDSDIANLS